MEEQILILLGRPDYVPSNVPELLRQLRWSANRQQELQGVLRGLEQSGRITRTKGNRYIQSREADLIPGRIRMNKQGKGFLQPDDVGLKEIMIPGEATGTALHEDRVLVRRDVKAKGLRPGCVEQESGVVIRILERKRTQIVGTLQRGREFLYVIPDDPRMPQDIYVPQPRDVGRPANVGDKVVVELHEWESRHTSPEGEIIEVLGAPDEEGVDMLSVLRQYNLPLHFPKNVLAEARAIGTTVAPNELAGREDCRRHMVVTIDPDDAKDFDDAICLQRVSHDQWKLWVHIADVSHYVKPGTALDDEARNRGNSTYLVDRVIPMLPEALSNELCSLKPNVDRLTKCVEFLVSNDGRVLSAKFYPAVIHSQRRFTYKEVFAILQGGTGHQPVPSGDSPDGTRGTALRNRTTTSVEDILSVPVGGSPTGAGESPALPNAIERMLHDANELAQKIRRLRFKAGSLDLDFPETKIRLDDQGRVLRIEKIENDISHQLIEEYMLLANEAVAGQLMGGAAGIDRRMIGQHPSLPAKNERGESRREGQLIRTSSPWPSPPASLGGEGEKLASDTSQFQSHLMSRSIPAIYRVHEEPDVRRLNEYREEVLSHHVPAGNLSKRTEVQKLLQKLGTISIGPALKIGFLRSLMRARYAVEPLGHYGLAKPKYTHFTSPIRRYADLVVHRALFESSHGAVHSLKQTADHISDTERNSADAERDSKDVKMYAFLKAQLQSAKPQTYPALVTDVRNFGFFVDVSGLAMSGLVHLSFLEDDFYVFDAERSQLVGRRNRRVIRLGDKVQVQVAKVDSFKKQVDFRLARDERTESRPPTAKRDFGQKRQQIRSSHSSGKFQKRRRR